MNLHPNEYRLLTEREPSIRRLNGRSGVGRSGSERSRSVSSWHYRYMLRLATWLERRAAA